MAIRDLIAWLTQDYNSTKHTSDWRHPIAACLVHYAISCLVILVFHDAIILSIFNSPGDEVPPFGTLSICPDAPSTKSIWVAGISFVYAILLLTIRLTSNSPGVHRFAVLYEFTWLCNAALLFGGGFGLATCRPRVATGFAIAVSIDQILWYVDALGYAFHSLFTRPKSKKKMFPIGVCQYLSWPQTQWSAKITCSHHFWTIPLLIYGADDGGIDVGSYMMNIVAVLVFVVLSRWLTPFGLKPKKAANQEFEKYLNVNLSHELWQDIKVPILRRHGDNQTMPVYILRLNLWWSFFNLICFLLLKGVGTIIRSLQS